MKYVFIVFLIIFSIGCEKKQQTTQNVDEVKAAEDALAKAPSFENYISYGLVLAKKGQGKQALQAYEKAAEINPEAPIAWNNICFEHINQSRYMEAVKNCEKALSIEPQLQIAKNNLKLAQQKVDEVKAQAEKSREELMKDPNRTAQAIIDVGMSFYSINEFEKSIDIWMLVLPKDEKFAVAQNNIASSNILLGQLQKAELALNKALKIDSNNPLFQNNKNWLEEEKKKKSQ